MNGYSVVAHCMHYCNLLRIIYFYLSKSAPCIIFKFQSKSLCKSWCLYAQNYHQENVNFLNSAELIQKVFNAIRDRPHTNIYYSTAL